MVRAGVVSLCWPAPLAARRMAKVMKRRVVRNFCYGRKRSSRGLEEKVQEAAYLSSQKVEKWMASTAPGRWVEARSLAE